MKILGEARDGNLICSINKSEIQKFLNQYYGDCRKTALNVGSKIDLGKGHDFSIEIRSALKKTQTFLTENKSIINAITDGISIMSEGEEVQKLRNHRDSTVGLWATDKPDRLTPQQKEKCQLFEIE